MNKLFLIIFLACVSCRADQVEDIDSKLDTIVTNEDGISTGIKKLEDSVNLSQGALIVGSITTVAAGGSIDFPITLIPGTFAPASLQADIVTPAGFTLTSVSMGIAASAADKQLTISNGRFLIFGLNQTAIGPGIIAIAHFQVAANVSKRLYPISLDNPVVSDDAGIAIVASTISGTIEVN